MNVPILRRRIAVAAGTVTLAAVALAGHGASAQPLPTTTALPTTSTATTVNTSPHVELSASPTRFLHDGDVISVTVRGRFGVVDSTTMQICQGARCATRAPSSGADARVTTQGDGVFPFRAGVGTFTTADSATFACDPDHDCQLVVRSTMRTGGFTSVATFPLSYTSTSATTVTTATTRPPDTTTNPLCAVRNRVPAWLWPILVHIFGVTC
jgi:hypothetical protein